MRQGGVKNSAYSYNRFMKLIFTLLCLVLSSNVLSADLAYIVSDQAIIYSDMDLSVGIGYVKKGKKIKVGEIARKNGTVLSTVVSGRIAYIKKLDVRLAQEISDEGGNYIAPKVTDHEVLFEEQSFEDNFSENNHMVLHMGNMATGSAWQELDPQSSENTISQFGIGFEHRPELRNYSWAVGLNYISAESDNFAFKSLMVEAKFQYSIARFSLVSLDAVFGVIGTGDARLQNSFSSTESRGTMFGYLIGGQAKLFPFSKFGIIGGVEIRKYNVGSIGDVQLEDGSIGAFESFNGANVWAGVTYKI